MSDFGISRRLKRVRSTSIANSELDAELQASIRSQQHASKRSRVASGGRSFSGSFVSASKRAARQHVEPDDFVSTPTGGLGTSNLQTNSSAGAEASTTPHPAATRLVTRNSNGTMRSLWSSMSGFFGRDRVQPGAVRETVSAYESLQNALDRPGSSSNNSNNSPRDSGIYLDSRPSSRLKFDVPETTENHAFDPQFLLEPPRLPVTQSSESPLKRLQTASMSGLRKVKSLALRPQPSREDMQKEQCHRLMRKMSNLQNQLDECKQEFTKLFGDAAPAELASARDSSLLQDPASPKSDRGTQTVIKFDPGYERDTDSPLEGQPVHQSIESPANGREPTPENWPLPTRVEATLPTIEGPQLRRVANTRSLRTPEAQVQPQTGDGAAALVERALGENVEPSFLRRSLSTIPSSGDEKSPTPERVAASSENERPSSARSNKTSRIPRQSPRKTRLGGDQQQQQQQLSKMKAVVSSKEGRVNKNKSPRTLRASARQAGKASPKRRSSGKKIVGSADSGHYDDQGEWVWGPEAF